MSTMTCVVHHAIRRDLDTFATVVRATPVSDRRAWRALESRWDILAGALRHQHLTGPGGARCDAPADLCGLLECCTAGFGQLAASVDDDARAALAVRIIALRERVLRGPARSDPAGRAVSLRQAVRVAAWSCSGLPVDDRRNVLRAGEPWFRLIELLTRRRFDRLQRAAFHHLPDPGLLAAGDVPAGEGRPLCNANLRWHPEPSRRNRLLPWRTEQGCTSACWGQGDSRCRQSAWAAWG